MEVFLSKLDVLLQLNFPPKMQNVVNVILLWVGFAYIVGLLTRLLVWGGEWRRGPFTVFLVGLTGSCTGFLALTTWRELDDFNPFSPAGLIVSVVASVVALFIYQAFSLLWFRWKKKD
ncbi:MAG: hypothetical protein ACOX6D_04850 [Thermoguttaceae bacterium]|jgi:uncharacterized membrane protein YeaQ/YmgE (transglycosylase-associated protein family)